MVLRLLRGESLEALSREVGVEIYRLDAWRERAMAGLELGLKDRHGEPVAEVLDAAKPDRPAWSKRSHTPSLPRGRFGRALLKENDNDDLAKVTAQTVGDSTGD